MTEIKVSKAWFAEPQTDPHNQQILGYNILT